MRIKKRSRTGMGKLSALMFTCLTAALLAGCGPEKEYVHVGPNWADLNSLQGGDDFKVIVHANEQYQNGDSITMTVTSAKAGKLWVMYVDPDDTVSVIYPNELVSDNTIEANKPIRLPGSGWELRAEEPLGPSVIVAIVTTGDLNLLEALRQAAGQKEVQMSKALTLARTADNWGLGKTVINVE